MTAGSFDVREFYLFERPTRILGGRQESPEIQLLLRGEVRVAEVKRFPSPRSSQTQQSRSSFHQQRLARPLVEGGGFR